MTLAWTRMAMILKPDATGAIAGSCLNRDAMGGSRLNACDTESLRLDRYKYFGPFSLRFVWDFCFRRGCFALAHS